MPLNYFQLLFEARRFNKEKVPDKFLISLVPIAASVYYNCAYEHYTRANIENLHILEPKKLDYTVEQIGMLELRITKTVESNRRLLAETIEFVKTVPATMFANQIEIPEYSDGHRELCNFNEQQKELADTLLRTVGPVYISFPVVQNYVNEGLFEFVTLMSNSIHELYSVDFVIKDTTNQWRRKVINLYMNSFQKFIDSGQLVYDRSTPNDSLVAMSDFIVEDRVSRATTDDHTTVLIALANYLEHPMDEEASKHIRHFVENVITRLVAYYANGGTNVTPPIVIDLPPSHPLKIITMLMQYGPLLKFLFEE